MQSYIGISLTLTTGGQKYSVLALLLAAGVSDTPTGREVDIQVDTRVNGTVKVGDGSVTTTNYGYILQVGGSRLYRATISNIPLANLWVIGSADGVVINVEVIQ